MSTDYEQDVSSMAVESGTVALLNKSEIDMQGATAHKYPRSIKRFPSFGCGLSMTAMSLSVLVIVTACATSMVVPAKKTKLMASAVAAR